MKAVAAGAPDETLMRLLRRNTRVPDQVLGDLHAQFAALGLMERRVLALLAEHRLPDLSALAKEIQARSGTRHARGHRRRAGRHLPRRGLDATGWRSRCASASR